MVRTQAPTTSADGPTIAVIGCGAIAEAFHIPALVRHKEVRDRLILVDRDAGRASRLAERFGLERTAQDHSDILSEIDGAIVAVPPALHVPISRDCLAAGVHVLCEKPLAHSAGEVHELMNLASVSGVSLGVNNMRRLFGTSKLVKEIVEAGELGVIRTFEYYQGEKFDWPVATGSNFGRGGGGRGVFSDLGAHIVDLAQWWLGGDLELERYADDSRGGTEAVAWVDFSTGTCRGKIRLSWLTRYRNTYRIVGDMGAVEGQLFDERTILLTDPHGKARESRSTSRVDVSHAMIDGFIEAVRARVPQPVPAEDVLPSIAFLEACYGNRTTLPAPWYQNAAPLEEL